MRTRVTLALFISFLLVLGASWQRADKEKSVIKISAETPTNIDTYQNLEPASTSDLSATDDKNKNGEGLTTTDLIGRQLMSEYISLATSGQISEAELVKLGDKYADSIAEIKTAPRISSLDINVVSNTKANFQKYDLITTQIERRRIKSVGSIDEKMMQVSSSDESLDETVRKISLSYKNAAEELKNIDVPASLLQLHTNLVNNYLSISSGMEYIDEKNADSAISFAGIVSAKNSLASGERIIEDIIKVLVANGLEN